MTDAITIRDSQIANLTKQVEELNKERKRLTDFFSLGLTGKSVYGEIPAPAEPEAEDDDKEVTELNAFPPSRARAFARKKQDRNMEQFGKDQAEADRLIAEVQEAGRLAAEQQAK